MQKNIRKYVAAMLLLVGLATFSSCNKGYGCPSELSVKAATTIVKALK